MRNKNLNGVYSIFEEQAGQRLDTALTAFFPDLSLREIRRLWGEHLIELNGRHARKGMAVKPGDVIHISPAYADGLAENEDNPAVGAMNNVPVEFSSIKKGGFASLQKGAPRSDFESGYSAPEPDLKEVRILKQENGILALYKPAGLHSAALPGGRGGASLEALLPGLCAEAGLEPGVRLFNRLDCLTTGMVLACENDDAMRVCEQAELAGEMEKRYLAIVSGQVHSEITVKNALDTDSRTKTKVLPRPDPDPLRHSVITPLCAGKAEEFGLDGAALPAEAELACTLVQAVIRRGARHQIRAHLACAGNPIWGDPLYNPLFPQSSELYLHHFALSLPGFFCLSAPPWGDTALRVVSGLFPGLFAPEK